MELKIIEWNIHGADDVNGRAESCSAYKNTQKSRYFRLKSGF